MPNGSQLSNHEVVVLAAYLLGAESHAVDTEDVAIKANELAPGRFTWRKYKFISLETVRKGLWDATRPEKGGPYLSGSEVKGWRLTKTGFDFATQQTKSRGVPYPNKARTSAAGRAAQAREIKRMLSEDAFLKIRGGLTTAITKSEAERFFRIDDYITGEARAAKIERFRIIAQNHNELQQAISLLSALVQGD